MDLERVRITEQLESVLTFIQHNEIMDSASALPVQTNAWLHHQHYTALLLKIASYCGYFQSVSTLRYDVKTKLSAPYFDMSTGDEIALEQKVSQLMYVLEPSLHSGSGSGEDGEEHYANKDIEVSRYLWN